MYIADALRRAGGWQLPQEADLYSFEASAIAAAQDLRLESAGQMERLAELIFALDRPRWIEWPVKEIGPLMSRITPIAPSALRYLEQSARRMGILIQPAGQDAKLRIAGIRQNDMPLVADFQFRILRPAGPLYSGPEAIRTAAIFDSGAAGLASAMDELRQNSKLMDVERTVWMAHRLSRIIPMDNLDQTVRAALRTWGPMVGVAAIAFTALLSIDAPEIRKETRQGGKSGAKISVTKLSDDRLHVVTLRLSDPEIQRIYTGSGGGPRSGMARHLVRGHMFLARNGKMTWRRPHWRGDPNKRILHRVV